MKPRTDIKIHSGFVVQLALLLLFLPLKWVIGFLAAITVHESAHFLMLKLLGVSVSGISVMCFGAKMHTGMMDPWQEAASALAGPVGSMLLLFCGHIFPEAAVCAAFHAALNLIPVCPLDGGRSISAVLRALLGEDKGNRVSAAVGFVSCVFITLASVSAVRYLGVLAFLPLLLLVKQMAAFLQAKQQLHLTNAFKVLNCLRKK